MQGRPAGMAPNTCVPLASFFSLLFLLYSHFAAACTTSPCRPTIPTQPAVVPPHSRPRVIPPKLPPPNPFCPRDALKLGACANVLGLVNVVVGKPPSGSTPCCSLLKGLADAEVAACLCTAIKANVLGVITTNLHLALSAVVSACQKEVPDGFKCV